MTITYTLMTEGQVTAFLFACVAIGLVFAVIQYTRVAAVKLQEEVDKALGKSGNKQAGLVLAEEGATIDLAKLIQINSAISEGANAFLVAEYKVMAIFIVLFGALVFGLVGSAGNCGGEAFISKAAYDHGFKLAKNNTCNPITNYTLTGADGKAVLSEVGLYPCVRVKTEGSCVAQGGFTTLAFVLGGVTSILCGYIGMAIAVYANVRTSVMCITSWTQGFNTAFNAGSVMGFSLVSIGLGLLYSTILVFRSIASINSEYEILFECITGYGLGGSSIALFGRVGGGIYTKAADVGADLVGKVENNIPEDDPRNPAVIADNVGDNVGDIAGMGADLFGSFAESTCAALVIASVSPDLAEKWTYLMFPLLITASGILGSLITTIFATDVPGLQVQQASHVERNLKIQLFVSTFIMTPTVYILTQVALPQGIDNAGVIPGSAAGFCTKVAQIINLYVDANNVPNGNIIMCLGRTTPTQAFVCVIAGLWSGMIIGFWTEYMTSYSYQPVLDIAEASNYGAGPNIIFGLAAGYKSVVVPTFCLAITIFLSFLYADMYGIALAALGMLSTLCTGLTIDAYGPITDNAGGIAEMAGLPHQAREKTDVLDAAGNTTAAIGKGFAIGSASLVSLALFGAFVTRSGTESVDILKPVAFAGLLIGAMLPFWFSAMTIRAVGDAATEMVAEVRRQFSDGKILLGEKEPDYTACVQISTIASLKQMIAPGALVMLSPIVMGLLFGTEGVTGLLAGSLVAGVQMAISSSNSGGAWDNAKKYLEAQGKKGSDQHKAAVVGDTVGDPLKDTSGPALNILMKLMAIISLVFAPVFVSTNLYAHLKSK